uniref:KT1 n=1 Tax=Eudiplozoon nipponicum TaxID=116851 RepID=A0A2P1FT08_EUDNI|nr:KT1 [Eudiplozoon nipponicum]
MGSKLILSMALLAMAVATLWIAEVSGGVPKFHSGGQMSGGAHKFLLGGQMSGEVPKFLLDGQTTASPLSTCQLPQMVGMCRASFPRFYFDGKKCTEFIYGGCGGNANNFQTKAECESTCPVV